MPLRGWGGDALARYFRVLRDVGRVGRVGVEVSRSPEEVTAGAAYLRDGWAALPGNGGEVGMPELGVRIAYADSIGTVHGNVLLKVDGVRLVAVAEPREEAGRKPASEQYVEWHPKMQAPVDRRGVDVAILGTPSAMRSDQAVLAVRAGEHVVSEKPLAVGVECADRAVYQSARTGERAAFPHEGR